MKLKSRPSPWVTLSIAFVAGMLLATVYVVFKRHDAPARDQRLLEAVESEIVVEYEPETGATNGFPRNAGPSSAQPQEGEVTFAFESRGGASVEGVAQEQASELDPSKAIRRTPLAPDLIQKLEIPDEFRLAMLAVDGSPSLRARAEFLSTLQSADAVPWDEEATRMLDAVFADRLARFPRQVASEFQFRTACLGEMCQVQVRGPSTSSIEAMSPELAIQMRNLPNELANWLAGQPWFGNGRFMKFVPDINHLVGVVDGGLYMLLLTESGIKVR